MRNPVLFNGSGTPLSWGFIYDDRKCCVMDILDAIEDATNEMELQDNINSLNLYVYFDIDRVTSDYVRLKAWDTLGNIRYIKAEF